MTSAHVAGDGIAALAMTRLLLDHGWAVHLDLRRRQAAPVLVLDALTAQLVGHVFPASDALSGCHSLRGRLVRWGPRDSPMEVSAPALVVPHAFLVERLLARLTAGNHSRLIVRHEGVSALPQDAAPASPSPAWFVDARGRGSSPETRRRCFGARRMLAGHVALRAGVDASLACIEVTADGWVFMAPVAHGRAFVQAMVADVGPEPQRQLESALAATREIRGRLTPSVERVTAFEAAPSIAELVCRPGWIAVGDRAMAVDPVCGDGVGYALRGAILGAAVLDAIASGEDTAGCLAHFQSRLEAAFVHHLKACHELYSQAGFGRAWDSELEASARGAQLDTRASARPRFRFGLRGFTLAPLETVTPG